MNYETYKTIGDKMKTTVICLLVVMFVILAGCAGMTSYNSKLSNQDKEYLVAIKDEEPIFKLSGDIADEAWARAQTFIARHSTMKIQNMSEFIVSTYGPASSGRYGHMSPKFGYHVTRLNIRGESEFTIDVSANEHYYDIIANHNMKMLAHYMKTGELFVHLIDKRVDYEAIQPTKPKHRSQNTY